MNAHSVSTREAGRRPRIRIVLALMAIMPGGFAAGLAATRLAGALLPSIGQCMASSACDPTTGTCACTASCDPDIGTCEQRDSSPPQYRYCACAESVGGPPANVCAAYLESSDGGRTWSHRCTPPSGCPEYAPKCVRIAGGACRCSP